MLRGFGRPWLDTTSSKLKAGLSGRHLEASKMLTCGLETLGFEVEHDLGSERCHRRDVSAPERDGLLS